MNHDFIMHHYSEEKKRKADEAKSAAKAKREAQFQAKWDTKERRRIAAAEGESPRRFVLHGLVVWFDIVSHAHIICVFFHTEAKAAAEAKRMADLRAIWEADERRRIADEGKSKNIPTYILRVLYCFGLSCISLCHKSCSYELPEANARRDVQLKMKKEADEKAQAAKNYYDDYTVGTSFNQSLHTKNYFEDYTAASFGQSDYVGDTVATTGNQSRYEDYTVATCNQSRARLLLDEERSNVDDYTVATEDTNNDGGFGECATQASTKSGWLSLRSMKSEDDTKTIESSVSVEQDEAVKNDVGGFSWFGFGKSTSEEVDTDTAYEEDTKTAFTEDDTTTTFTEEGTKTTFTEDTKAVETSISVEDETKNSGGFSWFGLKEEDTATAFTEQDAKTTSSEETKVTTNNEASAVKQEDSNIGAALTAALVLPGALLLGGYAWMNGVPENETPEIEEVEPPVPRKKQPKLKLWKKKKKKDDTAERERIAEENQRILEESKLAKERKQAVKQRNIEEARAATEAKREAKLRAKKDAEESRRVANEGKLSDCI